MRSQTQVQLWGPITRQTIHKVTNRQPLLAEPPVSSRQGRAPAMGSRFREMRSAFSLQSKRAGSGSFFPDPALRLWHSRWPVGEGVGIGGMGDGARVAPGAGYEWWAVWSHARNRDAGNDILPAIPSARGHNMGSISLLDGVRHHYGMGQDQSRHHGYGSRRRPLLLIAEPEAALDLAMQHLDLPALPVPPDQVMEETSYTQGACASFASRPGSSTKPKGCRD